MAEIVVIKTSDGQIADVYELSDIEYTDQDLAQFQAYMRRLNLDYQLVVTHEKPMTLLQIARFQRRVLKLEEENESEEEWQCLDPRCPDAATAPYHSHPGPQRTGD